MIKNLPYGRTTLPVDFPEKLDVEWVQTDYGPAALDAPALLRQRLRNPIATKPLAEQARGARRVTIVIDDITRPTPSKQMLPALVSELHDAGVSAEGIRILVGV